MCSLENIATVLISDFINKIEARGVRTLDELREFGVYTDFSYYRMRYTCYYIYADIYYSMVYTKLSLPINKLPNRGGMSTGDYDASVCVFIRRLLDEALCVYPNRMLFSLLTPPECEQTYYEIKNADI